MKNLIATLVFVFVGNILIGQPVITQVNTYLIGDQTEIAWCDNPTEPGDAGVNVTWDFSGLNEVEELVFNYVEPASTVFGYAFPNATLCGVDDENNHSFYSLTGGFLTVEGYAGYVEGESDSLKIVFSDTEQYIPIPFEFGDSHSDVFAGSSELLGFTANINGEVSFEADAYGTLILPNGTYTNVIRYHLTREQQTSVLGQSSTSTKEQWGWMSADHRFWLCLMETNNDGFGDEDIVWYAKNPLTLSVQNERRAHLNVYPNPISSGQIVTIDAGFDGMAEVCIHAMNGALVHDSKRFISSGPNTIIETGELPPGFYTLTIATQQQRQVSTIVIY